MKLDLVMRKFATFDYCGRGAFVYTSCLQPCTPVFALSGITSQNATQIDPPCDDVRYKRKRSLFDKNTQCQGG